MRIRIRNLVTQHIPYCRYRYHLSKNFDNNGPVPVRYLLKPKAIEKNLISN